jgi:D-amino peptidase
MRVYISVDMEGVAGVSHTKPTTRDDAGYPQAVELMVGEANAAIEGAYTGGATELTVNDSHGGMFNLTPEQLDPRARLVQGTKPMSMVEAARDGHFDMALFVGYHARAGHPRGNLAHTYTGHISRVEVNGRPATEAAINGIYLGALGVPVGMVSGDDALADELADWLPWAELVPVKRAIAYRSADSVHPSVARDLVREGARRAVSRAAGPESERPKPLTVESPINLLIRFHHAGHAAMAAMIPGFEREGDTGIRYEAPDAVTFFRAFVVAARLSAGGDD